MPYATEVIAIVAPIMIFLTATLTLRLTYFQGRIKTIDSSVTDASNETKRKPSSEIKKGRNADVEEVISLANTLASIDGMHAITRRLDRTNNRGFFMDAVGIGLLVGVTIISTAEASFDPLSLLYIILVTYYILIVVYSFAESANDLFKLEGKLEEKKT